MLQQLPEITVPKWLTDLSPYAIMHEPFPLKEILQDSLYYPACHFDGEPIRHLGGNILSFIYVDYGYSQDEFTKSLNKPGFRGYNLIATRSVTKQELAPNGWQPMPTLFPSDGNPRKGDGSDNPFYCWSVFQRDDTVSPISYLFHEYAHAYDPFRFSLLYLCADGVDTFQSLYVANSTKPKAVAIIQPGYSFGGNWTNFEDPGKIFARCVLGNPNGQPEFLLYGGWGEDYRSPCWPLYQEHVCTVDKRGSDFASFDSGRIGIFKKYSQDHHAGLALLRRDFEHLLKIKESVRDEDVKAYVRHSGHQENIRDYTELFLGVINQINKYQLNEAQRVSQQESVRFDDLDSSFIFYRDQIEPRIPAMRQAHKYWFDW